ncbi:MAG: glycosyltransferase family protein [Thermoguttaceae bacterium]|jgi:spore coat polysaccharide biosynthesis protein SpsF (cytidylyltransferase family)
MKPVAIIQARLSSTRLPGKVLLPLGDFTVLHYVVRRCQLSMKLADVIVATTTNASDDALVGYAKSLGVAVFRGSETDVLERYVGAAVQSQADPIVRITSDCPLIDPGIIDRAVGEYEAAPADYVVIDGYPRGTGDAEVMPLSALQQACERTRPTDAHYREHVMTYLTDHPQEMQLHVVEAPESLRRPFRLCVDEQADLDVVRCVCDEFSPRIDFTLAEIIAFLDQHPEITARNSHVRQKVV